MDWVDWNLSLGEQGDGVSRFSCVQVHGVREGMETITHDGVERREYDLPAMTG